MHDLAIIMPTWNRPEVVRRSLERTRRHFPEAPIFVFDDASNDRNAVAAAVASVPGTTLLRSDVNVGPAGARCQLLQAAQANWCLALDDDCYPREDFDPGRWVAMDPGPSDPVIVSFRCYRSTDGDIAPPGNLVTGPSRCLMGGASLLHRASVLAIGNYNPLYVFGAEDTDLARRVWASGRQVWTDPDNYIIHDHVAVGRNLPRESFFYVRNRVLIGVLTLPVWYGLPLGLLQAIKRLVSQPHKGSGLLGLLAGIGASILHCRGRTPLSLKKLRWLEKLAA